MWRKFAEIEVNTGKDIKSADNPDLSLYDSFCGFSFVWPFNYSIPSTNDK